MRSKSLVAGFLATAVLSLAATLWSVSSQHTEFGRIHHSAVTHDYTVRQSRAAKVAEWVDQHSPLRLNLCRHVDLTPHDPHWNDPIILGTNQLCWALNSPTEKTGWLSFCLLNEFSTSGVWEFAPCSRHKLRDVRREDLNPTFVGIGDPPRHVSALAGARPRTVPVRSGPGDSRVFWYCEHPGLFLRAANRDGSRSHPELDAAMGGLEGRNFWVVVRLSHWHIRAPSVDHTMKLGFVTAILPELNLHQVLEFAAAERFACVEVMCWPVGKAERKFAGVTHIDVTDFTQTRADEVNALCAHHGVSISALGYYPNPLDPDPAVAKKVVEHFKQVDRKST